MDRVGWRLLTWGPGSPWLTQPGGGVPPAQGFKITLHRMEHSNGQGILPPIVTMPSSFVARLSNKSRVYFREHTMVCIPPPIATPPLHTPPNPDHGILHPKPFHHPCPPSSPSQAYNQPPTPATANASFSSNLMVGIPLGIAPPPSGTGVGFVGEGGHDASRFTNRVFFRQIQRNFFCAAFFKTLLSNIVIFHFFVSSIPCLPLAHCNPIAPCLRYKAPFPMLTSYV